MIRQETAAVLLREGSGESPFVTIEWAEVEEFYLQEITCLRALYFDWAGKVLAAGEPNI